MDTFTNNRISSGSFHYRTFVKMKMPIIVGECGINHNGDLRIAKDLMKMAVDCGISLVKFQKRDIETSTPSALRDVLRPSIWNDGEMITNIDHRRKIEFERAEYDEINTFASGIGLNWFTSVWDISSLAFMSRYNPHYIKIPSALITNIELLQKAATFIIARGGQLIISSGMSSLQEIDTAIETVTKAGLKSSETILFHCHSGYPADESELNLSLIPFYKERYPGVQIGFSSHSTSPFPAIYAAAWGAEYIEVHITLNRIMRGSDQAASLEKSGLELLVREINRLKEVWGTPYKIVYPSELISRKRLRGY